MAKVFQDRIVVSIDVGTTKISVLVAQQLTKDLVEIVGVGKSPSDGLKKGVVVDVAKTIIPLKLLLKKLTYGWHFNTFCRCGHFWRAY